MEVQIAVQAPGIIAVSVSEVRQFGCPYCGYNSVYTHISANGSAAVTCGDEDCRKSFCVLADGVTKSGIGFGDTYPELQDHPRRGTPSHGAPDRKPEGGGEYFRVRGIGMDWTPGCFICGGEYGLRSNIAAFVSCKAAGERVVAMFKQGARLDYREGEPNRVQVKVGACDDHLHKLENLADAVREGVIAQELIDAVAPEPL